MIIRGLIAAAAGFLLALSTHPAGATWPVHGKVGTIASEAARPQPAGQRRGRTHGYVARGGGYSYTYEDSINTYGDAQGRYGSNRSLRDPSLDRQTQGGPFDNGFFFDSGVRPNGGDAPYLH